MSNGELPDRDAAAWEVLTQLQAFTRRLSRRWSSAVPDVTFVEVLLLRTVARERLPTVRSVADELRIDKSTASRQVAALERRGFLLREPIAGQRRAQALRLTARGRGALAGADAVNLRAITDRLSGWPDDEVATFAALLRRFNDEPAG